MAWLVEQRTQTGESAKLKQDSWSLGCGADSAIAQEIRCIYKCTSLPTTA